MVMKILTKFHIISIKIVNLRPKNHIFFPNLGKLLFDGVIIVESQHEHIIF